MRSTTYLGRESVDAILKTHNASILDANPPYTITVRGCKPAWVEQLGVSSEQALVTFDHERIEEALVRMGAEPEEACNLTTILYQEGWGGCEYENTGRIDIGDEALKTKLNWYRDRNAGAGGG